MEHFQYIYNYRAIEYQRMITADDVDGNLLATLSSLVPFQGKRVLALGTGTGRIPLLLNGKSVQVVGPELATQIHQQGWSRLPEWTGVWWKKL